MRASLSHAQLPCCVGSICAILALLSLCVECCFNIPGNVPSHLILQAYDACELLKGYSGPQFPVLVDQGTADNFLDTQLKPEVRIVV